MHAIPEMSLSNFGENSSHRSGGRVSLANCLTGQPLRPLQEADSVPSPRYPAALTSPRAIPGSVPSWAVSANDVGTTAADAFVEGEIYLPLRDQAGAQALATAVSTPGDAKYGQYLTPAGWTRTYAPTRADLKTITDFVMSQGLTITAVPASRQYVVFRGPASVINAAFSTTLHTYDHSG